nr:ABC transporter ATP-binding protein [Clostridia bacterium]
IRMNAVPPLLTRMASEPKPQEPEPEGEALPPDFSEPVRIRDLDFSYDGRKPVLSGLSFSLKPGEHVALAGGSGSGKSTLFKLLCGLYQPECGDCRVFGHPLSAWSPRSLRERISIVTQDPFLFDGSVRANLLYGRADATDEELERVLACVDLWGFVQSLPKGLDTPLGEGAMRLSGGQGQRLAIARALLKDARLVLLDEVTSALDAEAEKEVQNALRVLLEGRAALMITHRLSSLGGMDRIDFLESGRIAESGTYEALLDKRGRFYDLWLRQQEEVGA